MEGQRHFRCLSALHFDTRRASSCCFSNWEDYSSPWYMQGRSAAGSWRRRPVLRHVLAGLQADAVLGHLADVKGLACLDLDALLEDETSACGTPEPESAIWIGSRIHTLNQCLSEEGLLYLILLYDCTSSKSCFKLLNKHCTF